MLVLGEKRRSSSGRTVHSQRVDETLRHEVGHAFDLVAGEERRPLSAGEDFWAAYYWDAAEIVTADRERLAYYFQRGKAGRQETFAEAFAIYLGGGSDRANRELFMKSFPRVIRFVARQVERHR